MCDLPHSLVFPNVAILFMARTVVFGPFSLKQLGVLFMWRTTKSLLTD